MEPSKSVESSRRSNQSNELRRRQRLLALGLKADALAAAIDGVETPVWAPVCSRLGHDPKRHRRVARQLAASAMEARAANATLLTIEKTAADPWVRQAADAFGVKMIRWSRSDFGLDQNADAMVVALADRVDVLHVRKGGQVEQAVLRRFDVDAGGVRVAMDDAASVQRILEAGALGRFLRPETVVATPDVIRSVRTGWPDADDWLVHCTRRRDGPWARQTDNQYRIEMLLGSAEAAAREPLDCLRRIVRMRRLIAGATTSRSAHRVVCFSEVPLPELLGRRTYRSHVRRWDYEPFGIAIRKSAAREIGFQKVLYGTEATWSMLPDEQRYRFQAQGRDNDWTREREWRCAGDLDLSTLAPEDIRVFVPDDRAGQTIAAMTTPSWSIHHVGELINASDRVREDAFSTPVFDVAD